MARAAAPRFTGFRVATITTRRFDAKSEAMLPEYQPVSATGQQVPHFE
jgi:hypothetical protein